MATRRVHRRLSSCPAMDVLTPNIIPYATFEDCPTHDARGIHRDHTWQIVAMVVRAAPGASRRVAPKEKAALACAGHHKHVTGPWMVAIVTRRKSPGRTIVHDSASCAYT